MPRAVWVTAPSGRAERVWTAWPEVDVDLSDLIPPAPAVARATTARIEEFALDVLLQQSRTP